MKKLILFCLLAAAITSCGNNHKQGAGNTAESTDKKTAGSGNFYKRFGGTVAGQPVVVNLQRVGSSITGTYYYTRQGKLISLFSAEDTTNDDQLLLSEIVAGNDNGEYAQWDVTLSGDGLNGKWTSADKKKQYPVRLTEQYPEGTYRFNIKNFEASRTLIDGKEQPAATTTTTYVVPAASLAKADADFIMSAVRKELGCDTVSDNINDCLRQAAEDYFKDYRENLADMDTADIESEMNNYAADQGLRVAYNEDGMVVLENFNYGYSGGAHGNYSSSYTCMDVKEHRIWQLEDMLTVDSTIMKPLLEAAAREYFALGANEDLTARMLVDEVPVTNNVLITGKGICFSYAPYEIASFADGEIILFISYEKLRPMLTPAFMARMHLQQGSGSA